MWTDNNPLTYILSKARLDACEHRWIAKLVPFRFDIKYIPGSKNMVADALSREPFVQSSTSCLLMRVPYDELLAEAAAVGANRVQGVFRWSANPPEVSSECANIYLRVWLLWRQGQCHHSRGAVTVVLYSARMPFCYHSSHRLF